MVLLTPTTVTHNRACEREECSFMSVMAVALLVFPIANTCQSNNQSTSVNTKSMSHTYRKSISGLKRRALTSPFSKPERGNAANIFAWFRIRTKGLSHVVIEPAQKLPGVMRIYSKVNMIFTSFSSSTSLTCISLRPGTNRPSLPCLISSLAEGSSPSKSRIISLYISMTETLML